MSAHADRAQSDVAVVDVGSNSVRLVLYRLEGRAIWTVYNEKVLAGLGRDLNATGLLSPDGVRDALAALRRFRAVLDGVRPAQIHTAATAAIREAADGRDFIARVGAEAGLKVRIIRGEEEARLSALGVIAGQPDAGGVAGDLGGSSLELIRVGDGAPGDGVTLPLGPFSLGAPKELDPFRVRSETRRRLDAAAARFRTSCFYAVGGAWRNIALLRMDMTKYPLRIVHQYELSAAETLEAARFVARQSKSSLERIPGVSRKRAETLPYAAVVLEAIVERLGVERVCFSAYGLREGMIFDSMPEDLRRLDPLIEGCAALGSRQGVSERLPGALQTWLDPFWRALDPVFGPERDAVMLAAACRLVDVGARLHPDHRADLAFDEVLRAPIAGQSHAERAFLACVVFSRYTSQAPVRAGSEVNRVLSPERIRRARALGAALRLGADLSGRSPEILAASSLQLQKRNVLLTAGADAADLMLGEQTRKRLASLADILELTPKIKTA